ncbi:MAG TPA: hypothetical protein VL460_11160 [Caulobacteraceae bacterium]|nr:hypothetical protein [Caulobacteraceae bacterium]
MKAAILAAAILLSLPIAAVAQPRVVTTTTREASDYKHSGPVVVRHVYHPVRHKIRHRVRHPVRHPVVSRTVERTPYGKVKTTTVVR